MSKSIIAALGLTVALGACAPVAPNGVNPVASLETTLSSPAGQAFVTNLVGTAFPQLNTIVAKGSAASAADLQKVAYWLPWVQGAVVLFGPTIMTPDEVTKVSQGISQVSALVANPPADVSSVMVTVGQLVTTVQADLKPALK
jgi:hypothetical protein